jgi:lipopolysaccharide export system permease protein
VGIGVILAGSMFLFNDRVMPEANHRLKNLLVDIGLKSPTFQLREQVINEVEASTERQRRVYYLQATHIDPVTSELEDIVVYDVNDPRNQRTTYAERGTMAFNENQTDLFLTLYDGAVYEVPKNREQGSFQRSYFETQFLPIRGVANLLERDQGGGYRSDREMSTEELALQAEEYDEDRQEIMEQSRDRALFTVRSALGWVARGDTLVPPEEATERERARAGVQASGPAMNASAVQDPQGLPPDRVTENTARTTNTMADMEKSLRLSAIKYRVEIHKKYAIAFACIVFVLIGAPLAIRFPRGGVGMVITASVVIFAIFWVFLIGGETLADRGYLGPGVSMWLPNLVLLPLGIVLTSRIPRQVATARGGGWADLFATLRNLVRRPARKLLPGGAS